MKALALKMHPWVYTFTHTHAHRDTLSCVTFRDFFFTSLPWFSLYPGKKNSFFVPIMSSPGSDYRLLPWFSLPHLSFERSCHGASLIPWGPYCAQGWQ